MNACVSHPNETAVTSCWECSRGICDVCVRGSERNLCVGCVRRRRRIRWVAFGAIGTLVLATLAGSAWKSAKVDRYGQHTDRILQLQKQLEQESCDGSVALELAEQLLDAGVGREVGPLVAAYTTRCGRQEELLWKDYTAAKRTGKWERAIAVATDLIEHNPSDANYWWWRGIVYEGRDQLDQALADYKQTLAIRPDFTSIPFNVADIYERQKRPCDAALTIEQYLHWHPRAQTDQGLKLRLTRLYREGRCEEAARGTAEVRFTANGGPIFAKVAVNGRPGRFVVDTGASLVALRREFAERAGVTAAAASPPIRIQTANGMTLARLIRLDSLALQGASADGVEAAVVDGLPSDIDGLLGLSFLSRFDFHMDAESGLLNLAAKRR